jgi:hypothetical protein
MKRAFWYTRTWSNYGESGDGMFPSTVVLPDGERVGLGDGMVFPAQNEGRISPAGYVQLHDNVRVRLSFWEDGMDSMGRAGGKMEALFPKGSEFRFQQICPQCGEITGDCAEADLKRSGRPPDKYHPECEVEMAKQDAFLQAEIARMAGD